MVEDVKVDSKHLNDVFNFKNARENILLPIHKKNIRKRFIRIEINTNVIVYCHFKSLMRIYHRNT